MSILRMTLATSRLIGAKRNVKAANCAMDPRCARFAPLLDVLLGVLLMSLYRATDPLSISLKTLVFASSLFCVQWNLASKERQSDCFVCVSS